MVKHDVASVGTKLRDGDERHLDLVKLVTCTGWERELLVLEGVGTFGVHDTAVCTSDADAVGGGSVVRAVVRRRDKMIRCGGVEGTILDGWSRILRLAW